MKAIRAAEFRSSRGFSLIEIMVVVVIVAILASVAWPSYIDHVRRARAADVLSNVAAWGTRMEQFYLDNRNYGSGGCGISQPAPTPKATEWSVTCAATGGGQGFTITATGLINNEATYTLREGSQKQTTVFKGSSTSKPCWLVGGNEC